jgi:hypothetical protein
MGCCRWCWGRDDTVNDSGFNASNLRETLWPPLVLAGLAVVAWWFQ